MVLIKDGKNKDMVAGIAFQQEDGPSKDIETAHFSWIEYNTITIIPTPGTA
jgi:hypothetical protein